MIDNITLKEWNYHETVTFFNAFRQHPKDFFKISQAVGTKSTKQCVFFYYHADRESFLPERRSNRRKAQEYNLERLDQVYSMLLEHLVY